MKILVVDIGGTHLKLHLAGRDTIRLDSGPTIEPSQMVTAVQSATVGWSYDGVSIGYPGPVANGRPAKDPAHLGPGWTEFDFAAAFGKPVKMINDAAMQALGSYRGGRMLFLGLGTGLGSAVVFDGVLQPMELAHLPYKKGRSFEDYVGAASLEKRGRAKWEERVHDVVGRLFAAFLPDYVVLGGGNASKLKRLPAHTVLGENSNAFTGGERLWSDPATAG